MPSSIQFTLDGPRRLRTATFSGVVGEADLISAYAQLMQDPGFDPTIDDLVDLRGVERLDVSSDAVRRIVDMFSPLNDMEIHNRLAIVAPRDELFGMARMYQILRSEAPEETQVFRSYEDAAAWLGRT